MHSAFFSLAVLACPVGMGLMMWMMMRGSRHDDTSAPASPVMEVGDHASRVRELRAEIDQLKADRATGSVIGQG